MQEYLSYIPFSSVNSYKLYRKFWIYIKECTWVEFFFLTTFLGLVIHPIPSYAEIGFSAAPDPVRRGEHLFYALTVSNPTGSTLTNVVLDALLPGYTRISEDDMTGDGGCVDGSSVCYAGESVRWQLGDLSPGEVRTVQMSPAVSSTAPSDGSILRLEATVRYDGGSATAVRDVMVDNTPAVSLSFVEERDQIGAGNLLSYTLRVRNRSGLNMSNSTLAVSVPTGTTFVSATEGGLLNGGEVRWPLGTVGADGEVGRRFTVQVSESAADGTLLVAEAIVSGIVDSSSVSSTGNMVTAVQSTPPLLLSVSAAPDPVRRGEHLFYALTVSNPTGSTLTNVVLDALLPGYTR
ncbi:MAG: hypothetical protein U9R57_10735, partial [Thermodesulfobacteriota bacterium]|nr:hypothetical protein [Thermodesulfobacteriota bacterium]